MIAAKLVDGLSTKRKAVKVFPNVDDRLWFVAFHEDGKLLLFWWIVCVLLALLL